MNQTDTTEEARQAQEACWRRMTPAQRLASALESSDFLIRGRLDMIRTQHPAWNPRQVMAEYARSLFPGGLPEDFPR
jgi:hypothetical protein